MNHLCRLLLFATVLFLSITASAQDLSSNIFAFTHVAVIDVVSGRAMPDMTVIVADGRISAIGKASAQKPPANAQVINASGKFLIPGLWDMHIHWYDQRYLPLFLVNGVTGVRIMWGGSVHHRWQKETETGSLMAPRMVIASPIVDGAKPVWPTSIAVSGAEEAREAVRKSKSEGAQFIKVYEFLSRDAFLAIADESKKQGLPFVGHVPLQVSALEASDAGMKSIEHLTGLFETSSTRVSELRDLFRRSYQGRLDGSPDDPGLSQQLRQLLIESYSREKEEAVLARYKRNHTWQTPTLTVLRTSEIYDETRRSDPRLKYLPQSLESDWARSLEQLKTQPFVEYRTWRYGKQIEAVGMMKNLGVGLLAGTDVLNPYCFPGFSLHDELAAFVEAGLTPAEALRTATINPAKFLGREADLGTIAKGRIADLVLLDADPLQDIRNTTRINAVVVNGRLLDRTTLDKMLSQVEAIRFQPAEAR
jgi:imidazolonepropionase-like amidohydrolase